MKTIVVGFEESAAAERALGRAADFAETFGARIFVVCVGRPPHLAVPIPALEPADVLVPASAGAAPTVGGPPPAAEASWLGPEELAQQQLERARTLLANRRVEADYVCEVGDPADRLLDIADRNDADLIVVGSREHGLLGRLLARPVDETVARRAARDVLLVH